MIIQGKLDEGEEESQAWVRKNLQWFYPHEETMVRVARADSLAAVLAEFRFTQHETIRTLASLATKIQELDCRLGELDKYLLEARIQPLESDVAALKQQARK